MVPVALFRLLVGGFYVHEALAKLDQGYLIHPTLAEEALQWIPRNVAPDWYQEFLNMVLVPNWRAFAALILIGYLIVGVSYLLGYLVRPMSVLGMFLSWNMMWIMGPEQVPLFKTYLFIHLMFAVLGAGRCLGLDYYFFKRRRGIWW